jgi:hypothetical protein
LRPSWETDDRIATAFAWPRSFRQRLQGWCGAATVWQDLATPPTRQSPGVTFAQLSTAPGVGLEPTTYGLAVRDEGSLTCGDSSDLALYLRIRSRQVTSFHTESRDMTGFRREGIGPHDQSLPAVRTANGPA